MCQIIDMKTWQKTIKEYLKGHNVKQKEFAKLVGVREETLSRWLNDEDSKPNTENIKAVAEALQKIAGPGGFDIGQFVTDVYLIETMDEDSVVAEPSGLGHTFKEDFAYVKKVKAVLSGGDGSWITDEATKSYYAFRKDWLFPKGSSANMILMDVHGDSMSPTICDGDSVLIDTTHSRPLHGQIMAVSIGESIFVKRVIIELNAYRLLSDNPDQAVYKPIDINREAIETERVKFLGKIIWLGREI